MNMKENSEPKTWNIEFKNQLVLINLDLKKWKLEIEQL